MDYAHREHHTYTGSREEVDALIAELMDRGYFFDASHSDGRWDIACGLEPEELPAKLRKLTTIAKNAS